MRSTSTTAARPVRTAPLDPAGTFGGDVGTGELDAPFDALRVDGSSSYQPGLGQNQVLFEYGSVTQS